MQTREVLQDQPIVFVPLELMIGLQPLRNRTPAGASAGADEPGVADWPTGSVRENALPLQAFAAENWSWQTDSL